LLIVNMSNFNIVIRFELKTCFPKRSYLIILLTLITQYVIVSPAPNASINAYVQTMYRRHLQKALYNIG